MIFNFRPHIEVMQDIFFRRVVMKKIYLKDIDTKALCIEFSELSWPDLFWSYFFKNVDIIFYATFIYLFI